MNTFALEIITPERVAYSENVRSVSVPTQNGNIGILAHHVALFTTISEGEIKIDTGGKNLFLAVGGGFMEVVRGRASILVSRAYHADELNEAEIQKAYQAAKDALRRKGEQVDLFAALAMLQRSTLELKVLRRRPPRHREMPS